MIHDDDNSNDELNKPVTERHIGRRERFLSVAERRVDSAIKSIRLVGHCSNKRNYDYTDEEWKQMIAAIKNELRVTEELFRNNGNEERHFKFE